MILYPSNTFLGDVTMLVTNDEMTIHLKAIKVSKLRMLLADLDDDSFITPNHVDNLSILTIGANEDIKDPQSWEYTGYIDFHTEAIELNTEQD